MARVMFLATAYDPRPGKETTVYGPGHETDIDPDDYEYVIELRKRGMVAIIDPTGLPGYEVPPEGGEGEGGATSTALPGLDAPAGYMAKKS
jgi:hypothetical protein